MIWHKHLAAGTKTCDLQTNLLEFLVFFCVPLRAGVTAHTGRKVDLRRCMLTPFVCHPAEDWEGPVLATGPGGRVSMRISRLLEIEDITCCWNFVSANVFTFPFCAPLSTTKKKEQKLITADWSCTFLSGTAGFERCSPNSDQDNSCISEAFFALLKTWLLREFWGRGDWTVKEECTFQVYCRLTRGFHFKDTILKDFWPE